MDSRTVISLFSGAGGFDYGFARANFKTLLSVELLNSPCLTMSKNFRVALYNNEPQLDVGNLPCVLNADIRQVDFSRFSAVNPDVLIGGAPCQDFSVVKASKRQGERGARGSLYLEFARALAQTSSKMFVFENVVGLRSADNGSTYRRVLDMFQRPDARHDYIVLFADVVNAADLGAPQSRRRLIVVGVRRDLLNVELEERGRNYLKTALLGHHLPFRRYPLSTMEAFEGLVLTELGAFYRDVVERYEPLIQHVRTERAQRWAQVFLEAKQSGFDVVRDYHCLHKIEYNRVEFERALQAHQQVLSHMGWRGCAVRGLNDTLNTTTPHNDDVAQRLQWIAYGENAAFVDGTDWQVKNNGISVIYRRLHPLRPSPTVVAYGGGGTHGYHYERNRAQLTLRERARLQTFPDTYHFCGTNVRAQIGEAVPPLMAEHIALAVRTILEEIGA
jgi:DNA (cytosine-5)-methyltransferase 1